MDKTRERVEELLIPVTQAASAPRTEDAFFMQLGSGGSMCPTGSLSI